MQSGRFMSPAWAGADNHRMIKTIVGLLLCCCWGPLMALSLEAQDTQVNLGHAAQVLEDPSGLLRIDDVRGPVWSAKFKSPAIAGSDLNLGYTASAYWLRVPLQRAQAAPANWLLEVPYTKINTLELHPPQGPAVLTGKDLPLSSRPLYHRFFAFPIELSTTDQYFYIRATSTYALTLPLVAWQSQAFDAFQQQVLILQALYIGGLLALLLYNLLLFLSLHDRRFFLYSLYVFFFGLGIIASNGYGRLFLWTEWAEFDEVAQGAMLSTAALFATEFSRTFLQTRRLTPRVDVLLRISGAFFGLTGVGLLAGVWWPFPVQQLYQLLMLNSMVMGAFIFFSGGKALRSGDRGARFFVMAWTLLWMGVFLASMRSFGWLPTNAVTSYILQICSAFEMLLLSLALADTIHAERLRREQSQQQALQAQHQLVSVLQSSEEKLERAVQERTEQLKVSLDQQNEMLTQYVRFGSLISHEFRNPLAIITGQLSVIRKEYDHGVDHIGQRVSVIDSATQRLARLFEKWLESDRLKGNLQTLSPSPIRIQEWLQHLVDASAYLLLNHSVAWRWNAQVHEVWADEPLLETALTNLLENACKYSVADTLITIETREEPGFVGIAITDQGCGIAPENQRRIFDEFFRVAPESNVMGMGLGLAIVARIAKVHGGHITLDSQPGQGSSFCFWLPNPAPGHTQATSS
jgi:signal transduction histidine kinase